MHRLGEGTGLFVAYLVCVHSDCNNRVALALTETQATAKQFRDRLLQGTFPVQAIR